MNRDDRLSDPKFEVKEIDCRNLLAVKKMHNIRDGFELRFLNFMAHCTDDFAERLVSLMLKHKTLNFVLKPKEYFCKNGKTHTPD
jgi:hypothetical protein